MFQFHSIDSFLAGHKYINFLTSNNKPRIENTFFCLISYCLVMKNKFSFMIPKYFTFRKRLSSEQIKVH